MKWDSRLYDAKHQFVSEYGMGLLEFVPEDKTKKILDIGCGTGTLTEKLAKRCSCVRGIDSSSDMIETARQQFKDISFDVMDVLNLPYIEEWDIVFSNAVFHWIADHDQLLANIRRALKPGGRLICEFGAEGNIQTIEKGFSSILGEFGYLYHSRFNFPSMEGFQVLLQKNGFVTERIYDYDRPTPLQDGERGLVNWARQFFASDLEPMTGEEQERVLHALEDRTRETLWNGREWVADYKRLRVIAHVASV